jgi:hypothetical protein
MKKLITLLFILPLLFACNKDKDNRYTRNSLEYDLYQGSDFNYEGKVTLRELVSGQLEINIELIGSKSTEDYFFPAHLHFSTYDGPDSPIAFQLNPINNKDLKSTTILGTMSNGQNLDFEAFKNFDGHIKIHLAESGPDYNVILAAGNIGLNDNSRESFEREAISICLPTY